MAVTENKTIKRQDGDKGNFPVATLTRLYQGTIAFVNSGGYLDDDTASGANLPAGIVIGEVDNSAGLDGVLNGEVWRTGIFHLVGSGFAQTDVGIPIYATDNYTIVTNGATANAVYIGISVGYISSTVLAVQLDATALAVLAEAAAMTTQVLTFDGATGVNEVHLPTNLADALSVEIATVGDVVKVDTTTGATRVTVTPPLTLAGRLSQLATVTPVAAAGSVVGDAGALAASNVVFITSDSAAKGVKLPAVVTADIGAIVIVVNNSSTAAELYAESTGTVNGLSADASIVVPASKGVLCICTAAKTWIVFDMPAKATAS